MEYIAPVWFDEWFDKHFPTARPVWTPSDVIRRLDLKKDQVYRAMNYGEMDAFKTHGRWIIPRPGLKNWLISCYTLNI